MASHVCKQCGTVFRPQGRKQRTYCSRACYHLSQVAAIDWHRAIQLYESGATQKGVAAALGVSQGVIWKTLHRHGIVCRPQAHLRHSCGSANPRWKGAGASYTAFHQRLYTLFGNPRLCSVCGTTIAKRYDWANMTGRYDDPADYRRMCRSCHFKRDRAVVRQPRVRKRLGVAPAVFVAFGESKSLGEWANDPRCAINQEAIRARISHGWSVETAIITPLIHPVRRTTHPRNQRAKTQNHAVPCACGCGQTRARFDSKGIERKYVRGHSRRAKAHRSNIIAQKVA